MTEKRLEQLSAFMDGELDAVASKPVVDKMIGDGDLRQCWQRYHLIGDVMRNTLPGRSTTSIASRVSQALKNEPTILSPEPIAEKAPLAGSKIHRHPIGYAVAASVAVVGFLTVGLVSQQVDHVPGAEVTVANTPASAMTASVLPALATPASVQLALPVDADPQAAAQPHISPKLKQWVLHHEFSSGSTSRHGVPPNVRLATFTGGPQSGR